MTIKFAYKDGQIGVGDKVRVSQKIKEAGKERTQVFDGILIAIKNRGENRSFTVRKIGEQGIGIERIFLLSSPFLVNVEVLKKGMRGVKRAKLYYIREKSPRQVDEIYSRASKRKQ